jgi:hypothetical protein
MKKIIIVLFTLGTVPAFASPPHPNSDRSEESSLSMVDELNLDASQQVLFEELHALRQGGHDLRKVSHKAHRRIMSAYAYGYLTKRQALDKISIEMEKSREARQEIFDAHMAFAASLDDDQRQHLSDKFDKPEHDRSDWGNRGQQKLERMAGALDFDEAQLELSDAVSVELELLYEQKEDSHLSRKGGFEEFLAGEQTEADLQSFFDVQYQEISEQQIRVSKAMFELFDSLSPEQLSSMEEMQSKLVTTKRSKVRRGHRTETQSR